MISTKDVKVKGDGTTTGEAAKRAKEHGKACEKDFLNRIMELSSKANVDGPTLLKVTSAIGFDRSWFIEGGPLPDSVRGADSVVQVRKLLKPYAIRCLGDVARSLTDMADELESIEIRPEHCTGHTQSPEKRIEFLRKRVDESVAYLAKVLSDFRNAGIIVDADKEGEDEKNTANN